MDSLKPRPCCGESPTVFEFVKEGSASRWHRVECTMCGARGPAVEGGSLNYFGQTPYEAEAITAWNTRSEAQAPLVEREGVALTLGRRAYVMSEPHLSGYRVVIGFETRDDAMDAHMAIAALSFTSRLSDAGGWRPIETAPKDGREIIGWRSDQGLFAFRWATMEEFVPKDRNGDPMEKYDEDFADWWHDRWGWMEGELTPTHWQPLPAPPSTTPQTEGGGKP